jgi:hypothetical protein
MKFSVEVFNIKFVANSLNPLLFIFGNFWLSRFSLVIKILDLYPLKNLKNREAVGDVAEVVEDIVAVVGGVVEAVGNVVEVSNM